MQLIIDKLKQYLYGGVAAILAALAALAYFYKKRGDGYQSELAAEKGKEIVKDSVDKFEKGKEDASNAEDEYRALRTKFLTEHNSSDSSGKDDV